MSGKLMAAIGQDTTFRDQIDKLLCLGIAARAEDDGTGARPDLNELARWGGCSIRTVERRLERLADAGRFTRTRQRFRGRYGRWEFTLNQSPTAYTPVADGEPAAKPVCDVADGEAPHAKPVYNLADGHTPGPYTTVADGPSANPVYDRGGSIRPLGTSLGTSNLSLESETGQREDTDLSPAILPLVQPTEPSPTRSTVKRTQDADDLADATARWNAECGPLPKLRKVPTGTRARKLLDAYRQADDPEHYSRAVRLAGRDDWYVEHGFDCETFAAKAGRWLDKAVPSEPVPAWQPPLDGPPADDETVEAFHQRLFNPEGQAKIHELLANTCRPPAAKPAAVGGDDPDDIPY